MSPSFVKSFVRDAKGIRDKKDCANSWGREARMRLAPRGSHGHFFFLAVFFRVPQDELSQRRSTRSLSIYLSLSLASPLLTHSPTPRLLAPSLPLSVETNRNEFCTAPEMIPTPKWSPTLKWSPNRPRNDPHFSSCQPRNDPQGITEWWLNMGLWIAFLFFVEMLQSCHFFLFLWSFK